MKRLWFCTLNFMCGMILFYNLFMIKVNIQNQNPFGITGDYMTFSIRNDNINGLADIVSIYIKNLAEGNEEFFIAIENGEFYTTDIHDGRIEKNRIAISQWIGEYTIGYLSEENMKDLEALLNAGGTNYKIHKSNERIAEIFQSIWNNRNYKNMFLGTMIVCVVYMQYIKLV